MAASSFNPNPPFLDRLTVFQSRLGTANMILGLTGLTVLPATLLERRLKEDLSEVITLNLSEPRNHNVFRFLVRKGLIGNRPGVTRTAGRYSAYSLWEEAGGWHAQHKSRGQINELPVFKADLWLSDDDVVSTNGAPTSENSEELVDLAVLLGLISRVKCTWTSAGQLAASLRIAVPKKHENPMVLGGEAAALMRQVLRADGLVIRELIREVLTVGGTVTRDQIAPQLGAIVERAQRAAESRRMSEPTLRAGRKVVKVLKEGAVRHSQKKLDKEFKGIGVLEHRITPRLEWLCDLGILSKKPQEKNEWKYLPTTATRPLLEAMDNSALVEHWEDDVTISFFNQSPWRNLVAPKRAADLRCGLIEGYRLIRKPVGPSAIDDVCFAAAILSAKPDLTMEVCIDELVEWAKSENAIQLSGGRYKRFPEHVHISSRLLD